MKYRFLLLATIVAFLQINLFAEHVSAEKASRVAKNFMEQKHTFLSSRGECLKMYKSIKMTEIAEKSVDNQHFYVFNLNDNQGWVIVADDDRSTPILGYSKSGVFVTEDLPANIEDWLKGISSEVQYLIDNEIVSKDNIRQWKELYAGISTEFINRGEKAVGNLISTRWDQSPYYNDLCPYNNYYGQRTVTGCVATAMAQVVNYYQHPAVGTGSHSYSTDSYGTLYANFGATQYDWTNMPNQLSSSSSSAQKQAVATLMYHMGVSVEMDYGVASQGGSGAYVISSYTNGEHCSEYALKHYFGYKTTAHGEMKKNYTDSQWKSMVRAELDASRPLIYAGFGNGGHCFVCAGYDNNDKFYFNWGWSGQNDGYFSLSALNPGSGGAGGGSYSFTNNQQAIFGLEPDGNGGGGGGGGGGGATSTTMQLSSSISVASQIWFCDEISVSVSILNNTGDTFSGQVGAAVFDNNGNFMDFIDTNTINLSNGQQQNYVFSTVDNRLYVPGHYQVEVFYKTIGGEWTILDGGGYNNYANFDIVYSNALETHSNFVITTDGGHLIKGNLASINVDIKNTGTTTFNGQFRINISTLDGILVQNVQIVDVQGMNPNYHYTNGKTFTGMIVAEPGTYHLELGYKESGTNDWYYVGASNYPNPITVVVEGQPINADQYETNNTQAQARQLSLNNWSNHHTTVKTTGSNLHVGNDIDYYKIVLPAGHNYTITPRLHDSYNSGDGQNYSVDALFAYSTDGQNYSDGIDDVMTGNITSTGGTIYFVVSPYFSGMTGTYLLEIQVSGDGSTGVDEDYANISLYPNPVEDILHLECDNMVQYDIFSYDGRLIKSAQINDNEAIIHFEDLSSGAYLLRITTAEGVATRRIIKK
ncbi:MAG: thiol protease/hemagglutinin PrtT [Bacteroidales bacterium]|nr:thiol protease/hemagglutinin PrtT [Bacteroidales bacterium]